MNRTRSTIGKMIFIGLLAAALGGCYYGPGPYAYGPEPAYYGPPVYGSVVVGGGWHDHWR
jgi:hypothetical protein